MDDNKEFIEAFVAETRDYLGEVDPDLIQIKISVEEGEECDVEIIDRLFRSFHSTKGSAAFLGFTQIVALTHELETLLDLFRTREIKPTISRLNLIFEVSDFMNDLLNHIENTDSDQGKENEITSLIGRLEKIINGEDEILEPDNSVSEGESKDNLSAEKDLMVLDMKFEITEEMRKSFLSESFDLLDQVEENLLTIQKDASEHDNLIAETFRSIHSFKGNCGLFELADMEVISHHMETILDRARNGEFRLNDFLIKTLLEVLDQLKSGVSAFSEGKDVNFSFITDYLKENMDRFEAKFAKGDSEKSSGNKLGDILIEEGTIEPKQLEQALIKQQAPLGEILTDMGAASSEDIEKALKKQEERTSAAPETSTTKVKRQDVRVDVAKLDSLINLVGELVIAQIMVTQHKDIQDLDIPEFDKSAHHLGRITSDLQDVAMSVRMVPVSGLFKKMLRLVHDTANKASKKVRLETIGEDTEVDRTVLELVADPMVHLIRNSVDHGIDFAENRVKQGKPETGLVTLEARHEGGEVWIIIKDDGRGLNKEKILARGIDRGLVKGDGSDMSEKDIFQLILEPGFSTAEKITSISGRGVGMDVVKKNINRMQGRVDIDSVEGEGATMTLKIPLTLAIIEGMMVEVSGARYIIPIPIIKESLRPQEVDITTTPDGTQLVKIKGKFVPIIHLQHTFNFSGQQKSIEEGLVVVVESYSGSVALFVDEILGQHQTVIKSLSGYLGHVQGFSGCTILSDGEICLIIDINSLLTMNQSRHVKKLVEDGEQLKVS